MACLEGGRDPATPVVLVESAGRVDEIRRHTDLAGMADVAAALPGRGPVMILIGVHSREEGALALRRASVLRRAADPQLLKAA